MMRKLRRTNLKTNSEKGFLIPLSLVLIVGLSLMAVAVNRLTSQSANSALLDGLSAQAFFAAESGAQYAMNQLLFDVTTTAAADTNCTAVNGDTINFSVNGLQSCSAQISCAITITAGESEHLYLITSSASCGSG